MPDIRDDDDDGIIFPDWNAFPATCSFSTAAAAAAAATQTGCCCGSPTSVVVIVASSIHDDFPAEKCDAGRRVALGVSSAVRLLLVDRAGVRFDHARRCGLLPRWAGAIKVGVGDIIISSVILFLLLFGVVLLSSDNAVVL